MIYRYLLVFTLIVFLSVAGNVHGAENSTKRAEKEVLVFYSALPDPLSSALSGLLRHACQMSDLACRLERVESSERALVLANERGSGDAMRVPTIKEIAPGLTNNLLQVPERIAIIEIFTYTRDQELRVKDWDSLKEYKNGYRVGAKILEKNVPGQRTALPEAKRLFLMLDEGRLDTVIEHGYIGDFYLKSMKIKGVRKVSPPLVSMSGHLMVHKKHAELISEFSENLRKMKIDGSYNRIWNEVLSQEIVGQ